MKLTVNRRAREIRSGPLTSLLQVLREELGLTGAKAGCQFGSCATCTVLVDGRPRRSCLLPMVVADGSEVTTVEGLGNPRKLAAIQQAFDEHYAAQCGFCTSGMMLAATALLEETGRSLEREEVVSALEGHFCRCTGYVKIIDAIVAASRNELGTRAPHGLDIRSAADYNESTPERSHP